MRVGQRRRRDVVEREIVAALRSAGAQVTYISGEGAPDLLCVWRGTLYGFEVKSKAGKRTAAQEASQWPVIRSVEEALGAIGAVQYATDDQVKAAADRAFRTHRTSLEKLVD